MLNKIKKIFKIKPKTKKVITEKRTYEKAIDHSNDITFENEVKKPEVKSETKETKSETTSSLTFGE
tara:strand:- start:79 stop:276 length:198 start_codon:yes stop_codon:yes gene_type:complete